MPIPMLTRASVDLVTRKTNFSTIGTDVPILPNENGCKTFSQNNSRRGSQSKSIHTNEPKIKIKSKKSGYRFSSINTERVDDVRGLMTNSFQSRALKPLRPENEMIIGHFPTINENNRIDQNYGVLP